MFGYTADEMRGHTVARLHWSLEGAVKIRELVSWEGAVSDYEIVLKDKEGLNVPVSLSAISIKGAQGREIGQAGFMRDLRQMRSLQDRLRALINVGKVISSTLDLERVYDLLVQSAVSALPAAQKGALHLYDASTGLLRIKARHGYGPEIASLVTLRPGEGRAGLGLYEHAQPLNVGHVQGFEPSRRFGYPGEDEIRSSICVPITLDHRVIGTLSVDSLTHYDAFGTDDLQVLVSMANQASIAISNARQYGRAHRRMMELERLRTVGEAIAKQVIERPKEVLDQIAKGACEVIEADSAVIYPYLVDKPTYDVANIGMYGLQVEKRFSAGKPRNELNSMTGLVLSKGLVIVDDISSGLDRFRQVPIHRGQFLEREGVTSFVGISLAVGTEPLGVLFVNFRAAHPFADEELNIISILASQAAVAIQQARLFEQANREIERRTKEQEATQAVAKLLSSVFDKNAVWQAILDGALQITRAERGLILLWDKQQNQFDLAVNHGVTDRDKRRLEERLARAGGMTDWIMRHQQSVLVDELIRHPAADWYIPTNPDMHAVLIVPVFLESFLIGVIVLESPRAAAFSQDDLRLVESLAVYTGIAVNNAMQYAEIEQNALLREGLLKAGHAITALKEPQEVLQAIAESVRGALACDVVTLYAYDQAKQEIGLPCRLGRVAQTGPVLGEIECPPGIGCRAIGGIGSSTLCG